jgi:Tfp pilus assembly protein PilX
VYASKTKRNMRQSKPRRSRDRTGLALVGILLMLTVLGLLAVLMASLGSANQRLARSQTESETALCAAEAGMAVALESYIREADYQGNVTPIPFGTVGQTYAVSLYDKSTPPPDGAVIPANHTLIVSKGWSKTGASRSVATLVTERMDTQAQNNALLGADRIFVGDAMLSSYSNSSYAFYADSGSISSSQSSSQAKAATSLSSMAAKASSSSPLGKFSGLSLSITIGASGLSVTGSYTGKSGDTTDFAFADSKTTSSVQKTYTLGSASGSSTASAPVAAKAAKAPRMAMAKAAAAAPPPPPALKSASVAQAAPLAAAEPVVMEYDLSATAFASGTKSSQGGSSAHIAVDTDGANGITLGAGATIEGELRIPDGADANTVINDSGSASYDGVNDSYSPPTMVNVRLPLVPGDQDINWTSSSSPQSYGSAFSGSQLQPGAYGHLVVDGGVLELNTSDLAGQGNSPKDMYVFRSLTLKNGGKIVLKGDAKTSDLTSGLYVDEKMEIEDGSFINETNEPARLQVYVSEGAPVTADFEEDSHVMLYAPGSDVKVTGGDLYGSIVGKEISLDNGARVFYDETLAGVQPDPWGNGGYYAYQKSYRRR